MPTLKDVKSAYDFLTIVPGQLKTICDTTHPILPIWEREKRNHCFAVRPIYMSNNDYIYSPIIMEEVRKRWIFIIECKVLQPIGSVFEHSNQQKRFFTKEKFDEKFQKRIDYFSKVAMSFFANHGYDTEGFTINPYMVVNKVFSSYYKHVQFPIVTFDELKREIQL